MNNPSYQSFVKRFSIIVPGAFCLILLCIFGVFYIVDPLQLFHKSYFMAEDMLSTDMREQAAGIIRHYDYDSLILGTSHLENTSASEAGEKLGGKFVNISMWGTNYRERSLPLKQALKKNPRQIIFSMDADYVTEQKDGAYYPLEEWAYLYDDSFGNDLLRYRTRRNLADIFKPGLGLKKVSLDRPTAWHEWPFYVDRFGGLHKWIANMEDEQVRDFLEKELPMIALKGPEAELVEKHDQVREEKAKAYLEDNLLKYIRQYPQTTFHLVFPPFMRVVYSRWLRLSPEEFYMHQEMIRWLVKQGQDLPNLKIYGFENLDFPDDIANYKDTVHYHQNINSLILDGIATQENRLTSDNVEKYLAECLKKAWLYDIVGLNAEAQRLIRQKKANASGM